MKIRHPSLGQIGSKFGPRNLGYGSTYHRGVDYSWMRAADRVTDLRILAAADGTVSFRGASGGFGNLLIVNHGGGWSTYYAHCAAFHVKNGQTVRAGQLIATMGHTGLPASYGVHLHFELRYRGTAVNPLSYIGTLANEDVDVIEDNEPKEEPTEEEDDMDMIHYTERVITKPGKAGEYEATWGDQNTYIVYTPTWYEVIVGSGALANSWSRIAGGNNSRKVEKGDATRIKAKIDSLVVAATPATGVPITPTQLTAIAAEIANLLKPAITSAMPKGFTGTIN